MLNWRRPVLALYDRHIARSPLPAHRRYLAAFHELPVEDRRRIQARNLRRLLLHAERHVPHYRALLGRLGVVRGDVVDLTRFRDVPLLTRDLLRDRFDDLASEDLATRDWYRNASGGSTGEPVAVLQDRDYEAIGTAAIEMHYGWAGRRPGEPLVRLWGSERDVLQGGQGWRNRVGGFARNLVFLNSFYMTREGMARYVDVIRRRRPVVIEAYAESAYELARYVAETGARIEGVRAVVTSATTLYPFIREEVERAFGCPVLNRYGSREVGSFAGERRSGAGLDVFTATHWVEVVDEAGGACAEGEEGDVVVTCLTNLAMPLIRYRIGDRAVVGESVGSPTASVERLRSVTGRSIDTFVRRDGSTVPGYAFVHFLGVVYHSGWIRKVQVVQRGYDDVLIRMVASGEPPPGLLENIQRALHQVLGLACGITFERVNEIMAQASGKYRYVISDLSGDRPFLEPGRSRKRPHSEVG